MKIKLCVPGEPQAKLRARWSPRRTYTPTKTINYETYIKQLFAIKYPDCIPSECPLRIYIWIYVLIPASESKKRKALMEINSILPKKRPDYDNVAKTVGDALEKLAYKNDSHICEAHIYKRYSDRPRLEITIEELEGIL